jgi:hypothetical protein
MSTETVSAPATPEQIKAGTEMLIGLREALLPAKLKTIHANGYYIMNEVTKRGLPLTVDSALRVVKETLFDKKLEWEMEPAALKAKKANEKPATVESLVKLNEQRAETVKAAEVADAYQKEQESFEQSALDLINGFLPYTRNGQRIDYRRQEQVQSHLKKYLAQQKAKGASMKEAHAAISAEIQRQYVLLERERERV